MCLNIRFFGALFFVAGMLNGSIVHAQKKETPAETAVRLTHNPEFVNHPEGEDFCWNAAVNLDVFVNNYQLTADTQWLAAGITYYDFLIGKMRKDPEGFRGWIGPSEYNGKYWQDALVGDAIVLSGILDFSVLVLEDPQLKKMFGTKAMEYVRIAEKDFVKKWDARGTWYEDGPYGSYMEYNKFMKPGDVTAWITDPDYERAGISHPFNKQMDAASVCLKLFRVTGNRFYHDRAERIFFTAKSHFQYFDDHYCWNYFEPLTPADVDVKNHTTRHGVWVHPWRSGYQAGEVERIAEAYHYGVVFDEVDIKRIIHTNLNVMWNKDSIHPKFISSNGLGANDDTTGLAEFRAAYGHSTAFKNEGELWTGLLDFDPTIRKLYERQFKDTDQSTEYLLYKKNIRPVPPGFKRKFVRAPVTIPVVRFTESKELSLATVLPHLIAQGKKSILICQSWTAGALKIDLYGSKGELVLNLFQGNIPAGIFLTEWDGTHPDHTRLPAGSYRVRWTIGTGYREFPLEIR